MPSRIAFVRAAKRSTNASAIDSWTYSRSMEMQSWPAEEKQARTAPAAAFSMSASSQDQHGVLAAEFEGDADQPGGGALGDLAAGAGGAGEGDVVGVLDDLGADDRALADDDLEDLGGQPGLDEQVTGPQGGQRGLGVGLHHDGVARDEGGQRVADRQLERVVPGRDLADDTARLAQLGDLGEGRARRRCAAWGAGTRAALRP